MASTACSYDIIETLGAGGMGDVFRARHHFGAFEFAVKVARSGFEERVQREFEALRAFHHVGIVAPCPGLRSGHCVAPRQGHLCLELLNGMTCLVLGQCRDWQQALHVVASVAEALVHMHERSWVHRDVKPGNVMLTTSGVVKLIDFGLARPLGGGPEAAEQTRPGAGTRAYMAPEQFYENPTRHTTAVDCFALGGLLFHLLVGRSPDRDLVGGDWEFPLLSEHLTADGAVPLLRACQDLIECCTRTRPGQRYSARHVADRVGIIVREHELLLSRVLPPPVARSLTRRGNRSTVSMTSIPAQSAQPTSAGSALVPGTLFRANQPGHYVVRESGLCAAGKLPLSAVPELQRVPPTRNSWLRAGDPLGLVSDLVLRRVATDGAAANERLFAPYSVCELLCPSLTMFELPRSAHRHLGCRTGLLQGELQDASGRPIAQPTTSIAFFVADVEATGDLEQLLATVHIVHDLRTESDR